MKPKYKYLLSEKATIPEALAPYYQERDGYLILDVEGAGDAAKIAEFRTNNEALRSDLEAVAAAATGKTAAEFKGAKKEAIISEISTARDAAEKAGSAKSKEEIQAAADARITALNAAHAAEKTRLEGEVAARQEKLSKLTINAAVLDHATKVGLLPTAHEDIISRALQTFKLDDQGNVKAYGPDGKEIFDTLTGGPVTISTWVKDISTKATHLFAASEGADSPGGKGGGGGGPPAGVNPWDPKTKNLTMQSQLLRKDRPTAIKMAAQHGVKIQPLGQ